MKNNLIDYRLIEKWAASMDGVFSLRDLENVLNEKTPLLLHRRVQALAAAGALTRFKRGFYCTENFNLETLSQRLYPDSYISLGTVLARRLLIGSIPASTVYAVKTGRNRTFYSSKGNLVYCGIAPHLMFGCEYENGRRYATAEKAFLDTLYFYQKGFTFSFNIFEDINSTGLDMAKTRLLLKKYKNPKFIIFVKGVLSAGHS
jgi:hypothetical protein